MKNQTCLPIDVNQDADEYDDPLQQFTYALKVPETKRQYPRRLRVFMDFVKLEGDIRQQARTLKEKIQNNKDWFRVSLIRFFDFPARKDKILDFIRDKITPVNKERIYSSLSKIEDKEYKNVSDVTTASGLVY